MNHTQTTVSINREHKARLFNMIFGDNTNKKYSLSLYNALYDTNYTDEDEVEITTIEDALYIRMKNDVSILLDSYLSLWGQQSTFNPNMPVRGLMYFGNLYNSYIDQRELPIYGSSLVRIPTPRYIVFYNGTGEREPVEKLRLSDAFIHEYKKSEATLHDAVERAINECMEEDVLTDFLRKQRGDVMLTCLTEFSEQLYKKGLLEEGRELGIEEGRVLGIEEGCKQASIDNARMLFQNGVSFEIVRASIEHLTDAQLREIYDEIKK